MSFAGQALDCSSYEIEGIYHFIWQVSRIYWFDADAADGRALSGDEAQVGAEILARTEKAPG